MLTDDPATLNAALAVAASAAVEPRLVSGSAELRAAWSADVVLIGADCAAEVAARGLQRRADVFLLGAATPSDDLARWSLSLGAVAVQLPAGLGWLTSTVTELLGREEPAQRAVAVIGGSGGVGASTLAAAVALLAARRHRGSLLLDLDPLGGGLDLLLGAERLAGWRWPQLRGARGRLGELRGHLPAVDGVDILSMARVDPVAEVGDAAIRAVLGAATRTYPLSVVDVGRSSGPLGAVAIDAADLVVLVASGGVRGIAAARAAADRWRGQGTCAVIVRTGGQRPIPAETAAERIGIPLLATVPDDQRIVRAGEDGNPPGLTRHSALGSAARAVLDAVGIAE